jgi:hypothetical protein
LTWKVVDAEKRVLLEDIPMDPILLDVALDTLELILVSDDLYPLLPYCRPDVHDIPLPVCDLVPRGNGLDLDGIQYACAASVDGRKDGYQASLLKQELVLVAPAAVLSVGAVMGVPVKNPARVDALPAEHVATGAQLVAEVAVAEVAAAEEVAEEVAASARMTFWNVVEP